MDPITPLYQDLLHGDTSETPHQEPQRTCTRISPCRLQGCMICCTPNNHMCNLDEALNSSDATQTSPTHVDLPQPPPNHLILVFTNRFLNAIQMNDVLDIEDINQLYKNIMKSNLDFLTYDCSALCAA